jgi:hypothetical protein
MSTDSVREFCRIARERSAANDLAMRQLYGNPGHQVGVLRQELDSMVRAIWLGHCDDSERQRLAVLFQQSGEFRAISGGRITDAEMVALANGLHGWTQRVYKFGCSFIHLSLAHDFKNQDPFAALSQTDRQEIIDHVSHYHMYPLPSDFRFDDLLPILPFVFSKIRGNLECELAALERK